MELDALEKVCSPISTEITLLKSVLESVHSSGKKYQPMLTFFSDSKTRFITLTIPFQENFNDSLIRISESLHLYSAINAHCVTLSFNANLEKDGSIYDTLIIFLLSEDSAWQINLPYSFNPDNSIIWMNDLFEINQILKENMDSIENLTKDMLTMFYVYTHIDSSPYTFSEILSFLSTTGAAAALHTDQEISFYDLSSDSNPFLVKE